jgi:hypothetical protein
VIAWLVVLLSMVVLLVGIIVDGKRNQEKYRLRYEHLERESR